MIPLILPGFDDGNPWAQVGLQDARARRLADSHYSRQTPGSPQVLPPGKRLLLLTRDGRAVWGVCENLDPWQGHRWRVTLFRREPGGELLSSALVRLATGLTLDYWRQHYGGLPPVPLTTEVDPRCVRRKRDPGRCFRRAGWRVVRLSRSHRHRGALVLEAPSENS
jgi:hypothetical protein